MKPQDMMGAISLMEKLIDNGLPLSVRVDLCELYIMRYEELPNTTFDLSKSAFARKRIAAAELDYVVEMYGERMYHRVRTGRFS